MTTMIALIGDQTLPNFLPVRYYHPSDVVLIYTARTQQKYEYLRATLQKEANVYGLETEAYDVIGIIKTINDKLDGITGLSQPLTFNLTGGTKAMVLAACQVALKCNAPIMYVQSEGKKTHIYHYTWKDQKLQSASTDLLPELLELRDVFDLHLGPRNWQENGASKGEGGPFEDAIANTLRSNGYEVMVGVGTMNGQIDVDVAVRYGNKYGIIEAKFGGKGKRLDGIKQLSTAARHLGTYSQTFYVITVPPEPAHKAITDASNIQVISLPDSGGILSQVDSVELLSMVGKALKG